MGNSMAALFLCPLVLAKLGHRARLRMNQGQTNDV